MCVKGKNECVLHVWEELNIFTGSRGLFGSGKLNLASGQTQGEPITSLVCMGEKNSALGFS